MTFFCLSPGFSDKKRHPLISLCVDVCYSYSFLCTLKDTLAYTLLSVCMLLHTQHPCQHNLSFLPGRICPNYNRDPQLGQRTGDLFVLFTFTLGVIQKLRHTFLTFLTPPPVTKCHTSLTPPPILRHTFASTPPPLPRSCRSAPRSIGAIDWSTRKGKNRLKRLKKCQK